MPKNLKTELNKKAHFISGVGAKDRIDDSTVQSAQKDALEFLESLPKDYRTPQISSGTVVDPDVIVYLTWYAFDAGIHSVNVSCKGKGAFSVSWNNVDHSRTDIETTSLSGLQYLDIPKKIDNLKNIKPPSQENTPK